MMRQGSDAGAANTGAEAATDYDATSSLEHGTGNGTVNGAAAAIVGAAPKRSNSGIPKSGSNTAPARPANAGNRPAFSISSLLPETASAKRSENIGVGKLRQGNFGVVEAMVLHTCDKCVQAKTRWLDAMEAASKAVQSLNLPSDKFPVISVVLETNSGLETLNLIDYTSFDPWIVDIEARLDECSSIFAKTMHRYNLPKELNINRDMPRIDFPPVDIRLDWRRVSFTSIRRRLLFVFAGKNSRLSLERPLPNSSKATRGSLLADSQELHHQQKYHADSFAGRASSGSNIDFSSMTSTLTSSSSSSTLSSSASPSSTNKEKEYSATRSERQQSVSLQAPASFSVSGSNSARASRDFNSPASAVSAPTAPKDTHGGVSQQASVSSSILGSLSMAALFAKPIVTDETTSESPFFSATPHDHHHHHHHHHHHNHLHHYHHSGSGGGGSHQSHQQQNQQQQLQQAADSQTYSNVARRSKSYEDGHEENHDGLRDRRQSVDANVNANNHLAKKEADADTSHTSHGGQEEYSPAAAAAAAATEGMSNPIHPHPHSLAHSARKLAELHRSRSNSNSSLSAILAEDASPSIVTRRIAPGAAPGTPLSRGRSFVGGWK